MNGIRFEGSIFDSVKCGDMAASPGFFDPSSNDTGADVFDAGAVLLAQPVVQFAATGLHGSARNAAYLSHPLVNSYYADSIRNANNYDANLESTDFIGGVKSDADDWTKGWTFGLHIENMNSYCPYGTALTTMKDGGGAACELVASNLVDKNIRLVGGGLPYVMKGKLVVGDGTDAGAQYLQIDPGVTIYSDSVAGEGASTDLDYVIVPVYSKMLANGAPGAPVTFTTSREVRTSGSSDSSTLNDNITADWGGLVFNGLAYQNKCNFADLGSAACTASGEGASGTYGGTNDADNSGNMFYTVVKYAGRKFNAEDELNGIAFQAVGNKTELDYIQTMNTSDDGIEFFGGSVNAKHLFVVGASDDSIDWTDGWRGKVQHAIIWQRYDSTNQTYSIDRSIEADNYGSDMDRGATNSFGAPLLFSYPKFANLTIVGDTLATNDKTGTAILLREGTGFDGNNMVVALDPHGCLDVDDDTTYDFNGDGTGEDYLSFKKAFWSCSSLTLTTEDGSGPTIAQTETMMTKNGSAAGTNSLTGYCNGANENAVVANDLSADSFFDATSHIGACSGSSADWTANWAVDPSN